ncbi:hypothetical protein [Levilactobacillus enshiensis]|uniref:hypothetical protein n=1 Tax=Levilactobacillus enshiensis TaxID=2590213 RepID=UPI00117B16F3|nr:hypothetical protein [Levilactobacillus enshiensis]
MVANKSDFQKLSDYLIILSVGVGLYPIEILGEFMRDLKQSENNQAMDMGVPEDIRRIYKDMTEKDEAAFLIYFGNECMREMGVK